MGPKGEKSIAVVTEERGLNAKYLGLLWVMLNRNGDRMVPFYLTISVSVGGRQGMAPYAVVGEVRRWQQVLWRFDPIGHIGRAGGPTAWMNPENMIRTTEDFNLELKRSADGGDVLVYLAASDVGDGNEHDFVRWRNPRLGGGGKADLSMRGVPGLAKRLGKLRRKTLDNTAKFLAAAAEVTSDEPDVAALAKRHEVDAVALGAWLDYLALGPRGTGDDRWVVSPENAEQWWVSIL
ncbi:MAG: hypothetical protein Ct9H300mP7_3360 [Verrucomicrobiota bacterium]|nr:MAG: hypothetical protein Ct9H300mP7_3360 [Verrucomicrobiota bacterium]